MSSLHIDNVQYKEFKTVADLLDYDSNKIMYEAFNDLQTIAHNYGSNFDIPEIVVIGNQSDGKSSLIEAFVGFKFNFIESEMGTQRPLILQLITNAQYETPKCIFRKDSAISNSRQSVASSSSTHASQDGDMECDYLGLATEIKARTQAVCAKGEVSPIPIILCIEFKYCANLTVIDTPGFILKAQPGADPTTAEKIKEMNLDLCRPPKRLILCLEQATVEWNNSLSKPLAKSVDKDFSRTILVQTKFDNRLKELHEAREINGYLAAGHYGQMGKRPFFLSLPTEKKFDNLEDLRTRLLEVHQADLKYLEERGIDEKFKAQLGFPGLKSHLENLLKAMFRESVPRTLLKLEEIVKDRKQKKEELEELLEDRNLVSQKGHAMKYMAELFLLLKRFMKGTIMGDPDTYGQVMEEEKEESGTEDWPGLLVEISVRNQDYKLYGGAQYDRVLAEFETVAHSIEFPPETTVSEVATALGQNELNNVANYEWAASDIAQVKSQENFEPLVDVLGARISYIAKRLFELTETVLETQGKNGFVVGKDRFQAELQHNYFNFVEEKIDDCCKKAVQHLASTTNNVIWEQFINKEEQANTVYLNASVEDTQSRVESIMRENNISAQRPIENRTREVTDEIYEEIVTNSAMLFGNIRYQFAQKMRFLFNGFFLTPLFEEIDMYMNRLIFAKSDEELSGYFNDDIESLTEELKSTSAQFNDINEALMKFREVAKGLGYNKGL